MHISWPIKIVNRKQKISMAITQHYIHENKLNTWLLTCYCCSKSVFPSHLWTAWKLLNNKQEGYESGMLEIKVSCKSTELSAK